MGVSRPSRKERPFSFDRMTPSHFDLLQAAWDHNYRHMAAVWEQYGREDRLLLKRLVSLLARGGAGYLRRRLRRFTTARGGSGAPYAGLGRTVQALPRVWRRRSAPASVDGRVEKVS
jgi:hypothetical protein